MTDRVERSGLQVDTVLATFLEEQALPGSGVTPAAFWDSLSCLLHEFGPRNRALLARRDELQTRIDDWHRAHANQPHDHAAYKAFLEEIGYLLPEGPDFTIETENTDDEIARIPGPQLVVPIT
ncbi:MAG: malate synthase G, partial [Roseivivax sp.]|nr:malate synthase G [Roseivivax sp.]